MDLKRGVLVSTIVIITLIGITCASSGNAENPDGSISDALEEVSIEAVEDDDTSASNHELLLNIHRTSSNDDPDAVSVNQSPVTSLSSSDNSTAIATVYPDFGGSLSNTNASTTNTTNTNGTASASRYLRVKVSCAQLHSDPENATAEEVGMVEIVNMTHLLHGILVTNPAIKTRATPSNCTIVLFYTHWCPWSAKAAPHFNALPRAFRNIRFAAIDSSVHTAINTYFGVLSVPSVVLFYNGKILAKFNETTFNVNHFADFIAAFTDQKPGIRLNVTSVDFIGPIPSAITKGHDWYLYVSWVFIVLCFVYYMSRTSTWHRILELVQNSWREAEAVATHQHFHQD